MPEETRPPSRFEVRMLAQVSTGDATFEAVAKDMTRSGVSLVCAREVKPGSMVKLGISLVLGANSYSESLDLSGRVVWCTPIERPMYQLGAIFTGVTSEKAGYLNLFLHFLEQEYVLEIPGQVPDGPADDPPAEG